MEGPLRSKTSTIDIYIKLAQYPILAEKIRARMREEIFRRGVISREDFEREIDQKAVESQRREGVYDPFGQEPAGVWQERRAKIRDFQTDFYFGFNLPTTLFEQLVAEVLSDQPGTSLNVELSFNPELAPWELLFRQGLAYEAMPPPEREKFSHHLEEIKAVLIKGMISDQLPYIGVARRTFDIADLRRIHDRRIGRGKIGGKSAGMLLAWKILQKKDPEFGPDVSHLIDIPESYFIGTEVIYEFRLINNLDYLMNQKYRPLEEIRADYPRVIETHLEGKFPERIVDQLSDLLDLIGQSPLIVRSSSLLEDNFGFSFAGKYDSYFCPNQSRPEENLKNLLNAIRRVYASTLSPDAILYRKKNHLIDYDERMAILLQRVEGRQIGRYFMPTVAGVGFSQNTLRWNPKIRREDGFLRMVWGLGTRAVDRVSNDYARLVALSHPQLKPETTAKAIRQYSQRFVDLLDLEKNTFKTMPIRPVLESLMVDGYQDLKFVVSVDEGEYVHDLVSAGRGTDATKMIVTFDYLTKNRKFVKLMRTVLMRLEKGYERPVDFEFTVELQHPSPDTEFRLNILQCRPLSLRESEVVVRLPSDLLEDDILFTSYQLVPDGRVEGVRYIVYVDPKKFRLIPDQETKIQLGQAIGELNRLLEDESFVMIGPGRWGSANIDLGVRVSYADIFNTKALIEMAVASEGSVPALSYGTHFYQDLVETGIYALPLHLEDPRSTFKWEFFEESENVLSDVSPQHSDLADYLKLIDVSRTTHGRRLTIVMDGTKDETVGYLAEGDWQSPTESGGAISSF